MTGDPSQPHRSTAATVLFLLAFVWATAAVALWLARGWQIGIRHGLLPETLEPELPVAQFRAIAAALLVNMAALGWGALGNRVLRIVHGKTDADAWERLTVLLLSGHVIAALLTFAAGAMQLLPFGLLLPLLGVAGIAVEWQSLSPLFTNARASLCGALQPRLPARFCVFAIATAAFGLAFLYALAPVVESDGLRYHLFGPQEYLKAGGVVALPYHAFTNLPAQTNMLFMLGAWVGDFRSAQLVHCSYLPLLFVLARWIARLCGAPRNTALCAGLLVSTAPVVLSIAAWPFVDLSTLAFTLASIAMLGAAPKSDDDSLDAGYLASGLFAGAAIGTKLTALVPGFFTGLVALAFAFGPGRPVRLLARFAVPLVLVSAPWFAKSALLHGNPVYPAAWSRFGGDEWSEANDAFYKDKAAEKGFGKSAGDLALSPFDVTIRWATTRGHFEPGFEPEGIAERLTTKFSPGFEEQNPGPLVLALLPLALWGCAAMLRDRWRTPLPWLMALHLAGGWLAWFLTYQSVRFMLVPLAMIGIAGGVALCRSEVCAATRRAGHALMLALSLAGAAWFATWLLFHKQYGSGGAVVYPLAAATGLAGEERTLSAALGFHDAVAWLNAEVREDESVLYIGEFRGLYAEYDVLLSDWFDTPRILTEIRASTSNDAMIGSWRERGIRYVLYNRAELGLYSTFYFEPRFTEDEWERFMALDGRLLDPAARAFEPRPGVLVVDTDRLQ